MLIDLAKMAKIHKFGLANSLLGSPMATWLTLTGTLICFFANFQFAMITSVNDTLVERP